MADDGGSSGSLRDLFEYRFDQGHGLNGPSVGHLFLTALTELILQVNRAEEVQTRSLNGHNAVGTA